MAAMTAEQMLRDLHAHYPRVNITSGYMVPMKPTFIGPDTPRTWQCAAVRWDHPPAVGYGRTVAEAIQEAWWRR